MSIVRHFYFSPPNHLMVAETLWGTCIAPKYYQQIVEIDTGPSIGYIGIQSTTKLMESTA